MRKRNCRVEVCFTKDELSALSKKAKKAGMSIGGFIRHSVANKEVKEAPPADVPYLIRAMRQAGYNLDQTLKSERMLYAEGETRPSRLRSGRNTRLNSPPVLPERRP